jgi:hypothetical protein
MIRFTILLLMCFTSSTCFTQTIAQMPGKYEYYMFIDGLKSKSDVSDIEEALMKKKGVTFFLCDRFPVRYCLLKSDILITKEQFVGWLDQSKGYKLIYFGSGTESKENAIVAGIKNTH